MTLTFQEEVKLTCLGHGGQFCVAGAVSRAVRLLCNQVCQCVATKCVITLPSPVPSAVEKSSMPHRSKASHLKMSTYVLTNDLFNGLFPARLSAFNSVRKLFNEYL